MHVAQVNFLPAPADIPPEALLARWNTLGDVADAVASTGTRVSVVQVAPYQCRMTRGSVDYHFIPTTPDDGGRRVATVLGDLGVDVLHANGLGFARQAHEVSRHRPDLPIVFQDHADRAPPWWRRAQWRRWYAVAAGVSFTAPELARPFTDAKLFGPRTLQFSIPESSCSFNVGSGEAARVETGLHGNPCLLWVGHLVTDKDPLVMLEGVAQASDRLPGIQVWCAFGTSPLIEQMHRYITADPRLAGRVHLLGSVPHARIERLMQAADIFVSASHRESSGYALLEAMACGTIPVVTDIPSFRAITGLGAVGRLWPAGNPDRLADALVVVATNASARRGVRARFDEELSPAVLGRRWTDAYAQVIQASRVGTP
ncbi:glycosyltransferase family 4 protein [Pinirhizobacter sp.]|jgi:glycosyltransferase involved in cell wall biosynthesis|uniref:glycosyltransferase family 4 protein n=1 Tax=Pinirhizobacter sp. TaxID=2950432 RepID=UPI002F3F87D9